MASKRKTNIENAKKIVKKATKTSRPSKYIQRQPLDKPKSRTFAPSTAKVPVKGGRGGAGIMGAFGIKNK